MTKDEYLKNVEYLNKLSYEYHVNNNSLISDTEYDQLYKDVKVYEDENPDGIVEDSPTQRVGEVTTDNKVKHVYHMYSLENAFNIADIMRYLKRFDNIDDTKEFYVDCKMDGLSVELVYNKGSLIRCVSRGDGTYGEDVTANAYRISNIPTIIRFKGFVVIRGEVVVYKGTFNLINNKRAAAGLPTFSNCRNYASGSLRQNDPNVTEERNLKFYAWDVKYPNMKMTHSESIDVLSKLGFNVPKGYVCESLKEIDDRIKAICEYRASLPYDIDGVVIKQNNIRVYSLVGWNSHAPLFSIAFKFKASGSDTEITEIKWGIGRTGKLTPVATIKPVNLNGANISKVTLNNASFIENNKIGVGTKVSVIRSADVIPKISTVIESVGYEGVPKVCPFCGEPLVRISTDLKCVNKFCKAKLISLLTFIVGKDMLNIKGMGDKFIAEAVNSGSITSLTDIFRIMESKSKATTQEQLDKLYVSAKNIELAQLLTILNIQGFSKVMASKIVKDVRHIRDIKSLFNSPAKLKQLNLPKSVIDHIHEWMCDEHNTALLDELSSIDFNRC